jgi:co-chaperonin GroES (HSP10)
MLNINARNVAVAPLFDPLTYGSLILPDASRERCDQGIVKYVGTKVKELRIGDHVIFSGYTGTLLELEGEGLIIVLPERFVVARIGYDGSTPAATDIPGLYFKGTGGTYFTATYEQASGLIARGIEQAPWFKDMKVSWALRGPKIDKQRPPLSDYVEEDDDDDA